MYTYEMKDQMIYIEDEELSLKIEQKCCLKTLPPNYRGDEVKVEYYSDEKKNPRFIYMQKEGKMDGEAILLYPDQKILSNMFYEQDRLHGPSTFFSKGGNLLSTTWYVHGKKQGRSIKYYSPPKLYSIERFINDKKHLTQEYFYENGSFKMTLQYHMGYLHGKSLFYDEKGNCTRSLLYENGKKIQ